MEQIFIGEDYILDLETLTVASSKNSTTINTNKSSSGMG